MTLTITKPVIGGSENTWGGIVNTALDDIVTAVNNISSFPSGGIVMWSGSVASIPSGWYLCDGNNSTPDLRNRFIVGAGSSYAVGATGGADSVTLTANEIPSHSHTGSTGSAGSHSHTYSGTSSTHGGHSHSFSATTGSSGSHNHTGTTSGAGAHSHTVASSNNGGSGGLANAATGGTYTTSSVGDHTHSFTTSTVASHTHSVSGTTGSSGSHSHTYSGTTASNGSHSHSVSIGNTGGGGAHENRPPYYALAYIMKA
jgi:microcystin-dependent protein